MDILSRTPPVADHRIHYGPGELQFGDLWLPKVETKMPPPVVVFFHGGWWQAQYDLAYAGFLCDALRNAGIAVWSVEYARVGNGGGWPQTFLDAAAGLDYVREVAKQYPVDLKRVVVAGHSAGGHLAFWNAGRHHVPEGSPLHVAKPSVGLHAAVSLGGAVDLRLVCDLAGDFTFAHDKKEVASLMGGLYAEVPERYAAGDPGLLLPLGVPQTLLQGTLDQQIPPDLPRRYQENARKQHDAVEVLILDAANHFDVVDPESKVWPQVMGVFRKACLG